MPGKQIRFPLNKLKIRSHQTKVLETRGLIKLIYVCTFQKKNLDSHKRERDGDFLTTI